LLELIDDGEISARSVLGFLHGWGGDHFGFCRRGFPFLSKTRPSQGAGEDENDEGAIERGKMEEVVVHIYYVAQL
jgi:predicted esterase